MLEKLRTAALVFIAIEVGLLVLYPGLEKLRGKGETEFACTASADSSFSCTFTNTSWKPSPGACTRGVLTRTDGDGQPLQSFAICSGPMDPRSSVEHSGRFRGGNVGEVCSSTNELGKHLDWDACTLTTEPL